MEPDGIGLADAIMLLRSEIATAHAQAVESDTQFLITSVTVELKIGVTKSADGKAGFKVPFFGAELSAAAGYRGETVQTVTLALGPPVDKEGRPVPVAASTREHME
ncbi:trypco2 family protein [Streptomyces sp. NPDC001549]|uniref:trypco2 family protein n=1 Tax=Streptomyces sp. NPDC001549 TaxID=3364586 RepID=UPI0036CE8196